MIRPIPSQAAACPTRKGWARTLAAHALTLVVAVAVAAGCSAASSSRSNSSSQAPQLAPASQARTTLEAVDVAVRNTLKAYFDALNRGDFNSAYSFWSTKAHVKPDELAVPGESNYSLHASEMIDATADTAHTQLTFHVTVQPGTASQFQDGRNLRYVRLGRENGTWKIFTIGTAP